MPILMLSIFGNCCVLKSSGKRRLSAGFLQDEKVSWASMRTLARLNKWTAMLNPTHLVWGESLGYIVWAIWATPNLQFSWGLWEILGFGDALFFGVTHGIRWIPCVWGTLTDALACDSGSISHHPKQHWKIMEHPQKVDWHYTHYTRHARYAMIMEMSSCQVTRTKEPLSDSWWIQRQWATEPLRTCRTWRLKSCCLPRSVSGFGGFETYLISLVPRIGMVSIGFCHLIVEYCWNLGWLASFNITILQPGRCRIPQDSVREPSAAQTSGKLWVLREGWPTVSPIMTKLFLYLTKYGWPLISFQAVPLPGVYSTDHGNPGIPINKPVWSCERVFWCCLNKMKFRLRSIFSLQWHLKLKNRHRSTSLSIIHSGPPSLGWL